MGLQAAKKLTEDDEYYVVCAVRNPAKMREVADELGMIKNK